MANANAAPGTALPPVPLTTFTHLFNGVALTLAQITPDTKFDHWEARLNALGRDIGRRSLEALDREVARPRTTEDAVAFISDAMFRRWFGQPAAAIDADELSVYITDDIAFLWQRPDPTRPHHLQPHLGALVAGMIKGVLDQIGFGCQASAVYLEPSVDPETQEPMPQTQFWIRWNASVIERGRRMAAS
uniref:Trafficking protein particle complex subunit n=1 Tax=Neobodo designis TaxID=312471 RepID=A0A7S1PNA0_NEODS